MSWNFIQRLIFFMHPLSLSLRSTPAPAVPEPIFWVAHLQYGSDIITHIMAGQLCVADQGSENVRGRWVYLYPIPNHFSIRTHLLTPGKLFAFTIYITFILKCMRRGGVMEYTFMYKNMDRGYCLLPMRCGPSRPWIIPFRYSVAIRLSAL